MAFGTHQDRTSVCLDAARQKLDHSSFIDTLFLIGGAFGVTKYVTSYLRGFEQHCEASHERVSSVGVYYCVSSKSYAIPFTFRDAYSALCVA